MTTMVEKRKEPFSDLGKGERFFRDWVTNEIKRNAGLITTVLTRRIKRPEVITAGLTFLADIPVGVEILKVVFFLHRWINH